LSVDIDLAYIPIESREDSLRNAEAALRRIAREIKKSIGGAKVVESKSATAKFIDKIFVSLGGVQIKIESNPVIRGVVYETQSRSLVPKAEDTFEMSATMNVVSLADLYGGKLVAALDRQHPRDLFDVKLLLENEGITDEIRKAFVVYLASHSRPIHEVIEPTLLDQRKIFDREFEGMSTTVFSYLDFEKTRERLIRELNEDLSKEEREFLISIQEGTPNWTLLKIQNISGLPALQWKLKNVRKMKPTKLKEAVSLLKASLNA
jgi:predicted nucleotidyltransferase component of viral defense system